MIQFYYRNLKESKLKTSDRFRVGSWIYVEQPSEEDITQLVERFELEAGHLRDALDMDEMPRLEVEGNHTYVFTRCAFMENGQIKTAPLLLVVGSDFLMTVAPRALPALESLTKGKTEFFTTQKAKLFLQLFTQVTGSYSGFTTSINKQIRSIRAKLTVENISNKDFIRFVTLEDVLNEFLSELVPTSAILNGLLLGKKNLLFYEEDKDLIEDLLLSNRQLIETCKANLKTITNIREAYSTIMTNNLNRQIKLLTSLTIVLTVPTIIASIFGMNVPLPGANSPAAFEVILVIIAAIAATLLWVFARNKWL
ncbi:magnesium transporter CorA family protein [Candidatus Parcubacteria bacterium]|nr:magnesium transporter CorA family protein [Candidatus Parcubacteria bacterium]